MGYENIARDFRSELTKLKQAYETLSTKKDKEATEAAQKFHQKLLKLQVASRWKDDEISRLRAKAFDAEKKNQLRATEKNNTTIFKIKEEPGAQATEATHTLQKNVKELQVANKDGEIQRLQAEALVAKNRPVAEGMPYEIPKLKDGQPESLKLKRTFLSNASAHN